MNPTNPSACFCQKKKNVSSSNKLTAAYAFIFIVSAFVISVPAQAQQKKDSIAAKPFIAPEPEIELPLRLIEFSGNHSNDIVVFKWSTTAEINVNHFELEKSNNGILFTTINKQTAKGITNNAVDYKAEDFKPAAGINYYRLKFVCNNGKFSYSKIIKVKF